MEQGSSMNCLDISDLLPPPSSSYSTPPPRLLPTYPHGQDNSNLYILVENEIGSNFERKEKLGKGALSTCWSVAIEDKEFVLKLITPRNRTEEKLVDLEAMVAQVFRFLEGRTITLPFGMKSRLYTDSTTSYQEGILFARKGSPYISRKLVDSSESFQYLSKNLEYLSNATRGLAQALTYGIIHRDIKQENLIALDDEKAMFIDWGFCQVIDEFTLRGKLTPKVYPWYHLALLLSQNLEASLKKNVFGTMRNASPELAQLSLQSELRRMSGIEYAQSDLYSLGTIIYQTIVGELPWNYLGKDTLLERRVKSPSLTILKHPFSSKQHTKNAFLDQVNHLLVALTAVPSYLGDSSHRVSQVIAYGEENNLAPHYLAGQYARSDAFKRVIQAYDVAAKSLKKLSQNAATISQSYH